MKWETMAIIVKFFANFREAVGKDQERVDNAKDVAALLDGLVRRFGKGLANELYSPGTRELRDTVNILVNGRGIGFLAELGTSLKDGDVVAIFPPVSGGVSTAWCRASSRHHRARFESLIYNTVINQRDNRWW